MRGGVSHGCKVLVQIPLLDGNTLDQWQIQGGEGGGGGGGGGVLVARIPPPPPLFLEDFVYFPYKLPQRKWLDPTPF